MGCGFVRPKEELVAKLSRGFSLIELLIVVAIILIIAAIAIPNLLRSRIAANQASAVGSLRTINTAEITYGTTYNVEYSSNLSYLGPPAGAATPDSMDPGLIDSILAGAANQSSKSGYTFNYVATSVTPGRMDTYNLNASPRRSVQLVPTFILLTSQA